MKDGRLPPVNPPKGIGKGSFPFTVKIGYMKKGEIVERNGEEICCDPEACDFTQWVKVKSENLTKKVVAPYALNTQCEKVYPDVFVDDGYDNNNAFDVDKSIEGINYTDTPGMSPPNSDIWNTRMEF